MLKPGGTFLICNESNGDTDKDEKWTEIIGGMTIYKDAELKAHLEQVGFHEVQIHKKKSWLLHHGAEMRGLNHEHFILHKTECGAAPFRDCTVSYIKTSLSARVKED